MQGGEPAQLLTADLDVGGLVGDADDQGEVQKVPVVGLGLAREDQPLAIALAPVVRGIELVGVVEGEDDVHEQPGQGDDAE
ncbi:hypothetical protein D3C80_2009640 [compost metagenome]